MSLQGWFVFHAMGTLRQMFGLGTAMLALMHAGKVDYDDTVFTDTCIQIYMHQIYFFISFC